MTGYFISRKGKFRAYSQEAPKELVGHMLCTEKHMVKSSHRFCGGWREGNREECEHREKYTFAMPWQRTSDVARRPVIQPPVKTQKEISN